MRKHHSNPLPNGKGFLVGKRLLAILALVVPLGLSATAHAITVPVTLDVYRGFPPAAVSVAHCTVSVASGASGLAVLQAADASGCIDSFAVTTTYGFGTYLECINADCELPRGDATTHGLLTYWRQSESGTPTCYGLDGFEASGGKEIGLAYTSTATIAADIATGCKS